ncbi:MAG: efflux RND transporter periplasmic adaptor subunit [Deltaproteobacteria bacterium]|nr:efflux RND transporter periplasmic adaptor subunit [Deltaproteobacteria bacterium]
MPLIKKRYFLLPCIILLLGFISMRYFSGFREAPPKDVPEPITKVVDTARVHLQELPAEIIAYGRVKSSQPVILYSEVSGTLERGDLPFKPGQRFHQGDLLLKVDDRQIRLDINTKKSELLNALASVLPEIRVDFPDQYELWERYFNSCNFERMVPELPEAANQKIKLYLSRFNVYMIFFTIRNMEIKLDKHHIVAPFDGSIVDADLRVGSNARNGTRLGEIINMEDLEVELPVPSEDIRWIDRSKSVLISSDENEGSWQGTVRRVGKAVDTRTQTALVFVQIDHNGGDQLYDGIFVKTTIPGRTIPNACYVPRKALYNERFVYLIDDGKLERREVGIARREFDRVIINKGLVEGEVLVIDILQGVASGMSARSKNATAAMGGAQ